MVHIPPFSACYIQHRHRGPKCGADPCFLCCSRVGNTFVLHAACAKVQVCRQHVHFHALEHRWRGSNKTGGLSSPWACRATCGTGSCRRRVPGPGCRAALLPWAPCQAAKPIRSFSPTPESSRDPSPQADIKLAPSFLPSSSLARSGERRQHQRRWLLADMTTPSQTAPRRRK